MIGWWQSHNINIPWPFRCLQYHWSYYSLEKAWLVWGYWEGNWFKLYLTGRRLRIKLGNHLSSKADLCSTVPQRSVLDPVFYPVYRSMTATALNGLQLCLPSVQWWMSMNKLKPNLDNSEFLLIWNEWQRSTYLSMFPIEVLVKDNAKSAQNIASNICQKFHLPLTYICSLQLILLSHPVSAYLVLCWSG